MTSVLKEQRNLSTQNPIPSESILQNKGERKPFLDKNWGNNIARRPTRNTKEVLQAKEYDTRYLDLHNRINTGSGVNEIIVNHL